MDNKIMDQHSFFFQMKQTEIAKLRNKIKEYQELLSSAQRCFDKQYRQLQYIVHDKNYQLKMLKETLINFETENVKQKKIIVEQKKEIDDLKKTLIHLFGDSLNEDFEIEVDGDALDQDVEINVQSNSEGEVEDVNASSASSIEP